MNPNIKTRSDLQNALRVLRQMGHPVNISLLSSNDKLTKVWQDIMQQGSCAAIWDIREGKTVEVVSRKSAYVLSQRPFYYPCCHLDIGFSHYTL